MLGITLIYLLLMMCVQNKLVLLIYALVATVKEPTHEPDEPSQAKLEFQLVYLIMSQAEPTCYPNEL